MKHPVALVNVCLLVLAIGGVALAPNTYWLYVLGMAGIYSIVGYGLALLIGLAGQMSIGHAGFFAIGAYAQAMLATKAGWPFWATVPVAILAAGLLGALLAAPAVRVRGPYLAMVTIAFGLVLENLIVEAEPLTGGFNGISNIDKPLLFGFEFAMRSHVALIVLCAALVAAGYAWLAHSRFGKRLQAVRDAEAAARAIGVDPVRLRTQAFAISAAAAGLAGALFAPMAGFISPDNFTFLQSVLFLLLTILGGVGTLTGPAIGALLIAGLPELLAALAEYRLLIFGALLLLILWLRPDGLASFYERPRFDTGPAPAGDAARALQWVAGGARAGTLRLRDLSIAFGGVRAVQSVSFDLQAGAVRGLIGPNGAGKTSLLNLIGGFYRADAGAVTRGEAALSGLPTHRLAAAGVARTFQAAQMFSSLSVRDNLLLALPAGPQQAQLAYDLLALVGYTQSAGRKAGDLPFVDRRLVEIARALACRPDVLLLDEPAAGLSAGEKQLLATLLKRLAEQGLRVLLVEHDVRLVMQVCDRIAVLDGGRLIADGTPAEVRAMPEVIAAYLGAAQIQARRGAGKMSGQVLLDVQGLAAGYGSLPVLEDIALDVREGEVVALIGANGAGKSTLMKTLSGLLSYRGRASWRGADLAALPAHARVGAGLALVPEGRQVFPELTVEENLLLGGFTRTAEERAVTFAAMLAKFPHLRERLHQRAGTLSGGEQQMLALARALMSRPSLLLLDEPSLGLAPKLVTEVYDTVQRLAEDGATLLLVDQFARSALTVADRAYVFAGGRVSRQGDAAELLAAPDIANEYLGAVTGPA